MNIVVCIKQVPDSAQIRVHPVTSTIMRQGVPTTINPYDLFALEEALRLRDRYGGNVTVLTMGPPMAKQALEKALAYGADQAVLLSDRHFAGSETLATSFAISQAVFQPTKRKPPPHVANSTKLSHWRPPAKSTRPKSISQSPRNRLGTTSARSDETNADQFEPRKSNAAPPQSRDD